MYQGSCCVSISLTRSLNKTVDWAYFQPIYLVHFAVLIQHSESQFNTFSVVFSPRVHSPRVEWTVCMMKHPLLTHQPRTLWLRKPVTSFSLRYKNTWSTVAIKMPSTLTWSWYGMGSASLMLILASNTILLIQRHILYDIYLRLLKKRPTSFWVLY